MLVVQFWYSVGMTQLAPARRRAAHSPMLSAAARYGLAARAFVYPAIGIIALQICLGHTSEQANQKGALAELASHSGGSALLWVLGCGSGPYALWRLSEAIFGTASDGAKPGARTQSLIRAVIYAALCGMTFAFVGGGSRQGQDQQQETYTARLMSHSSGRWLIGFMAWWCSG